MNDASRGFGAAEATALYQQCYAELVGYLERLLGERAAAEDAAQDAGMRLIETARREPLSLRNPRAFLFHVATNLARDQLRRRIRFEQAAPALHESADLSPATDVVVAAREEIAQVGAAIADLPARPREILLLSRVEGLSHAQISERLGIAVKTVENHIGRALAQLALRLGRSGTH